MPVSSRGKIVKVGGLLCTSKGIQSNVDVLKEEVVKQAKECKKTNESNQPKKYIKFVLK